jgi:ribonucleoside-diphosphate reductase alpha chain
MISLYLRIGGTLENVAEQLEGVGSNITVPSKDGTVLSMGDALGKAIRKYLEAKQQHGLDAMLTGEVDFEVVKKTGPEAT